VPAEAVPKLIQVTFSRKGVLSFFSMLLGSTLVGGGSEGRLVRAARARDSDAFADLMQRYAPALRRFAARRVPAKDCEDVLQDTWIAAWEGISSFDDNSKLRTWLFSICYHKIQDHWRREHRVPAAADSFDAEAGAAYFPAAFKQVDLRESLRGFWEGCSADQRELLRLYYSDGLTLREISQLLARNLNTVKYQFYRVHEQANRSLGSSIHELLNQEAR